MKPILLRFSGLHSYRTTQTVDFTQLCQGGLFGIFGPTGSGKSTVLDAITLALYARVDRAGGNRQGILNHNEDTLFVDFTFETGTSHRKQYRVERQYKRSGIYNVHNVFSRLTEFEPDHGDGEPLVLADKDGDVTKRIIEIIGLDFHDFTRAVVLPQGKFAEFLSMKPADRRRMLERLFALEAYGKLLAQRINMRRDRVINTLHSIDGELKGLPTKQHVTERLHELQEAEKALLDARSQRNDIQKLYSKAEKQYSLQQDVVRVKQKLRPLLEQQNEVKQWRSTLDAAEKAEPLRRDLHEAKQAKSDLVEATELLHELTSAQAEATQLRDKTQHLLAEAQKQRQAEEQLLYERRARLEQGLIDENELRSLQEEASKHEERLTVVQRENYTAQSTYNAIKKQLHDITTSLQNSQKKAEQLTFQLQERTTIAEAIQAWNRLVEAYDIVKQREQASLDAWTDMLQIEKDVAQAQHALQTEQQTLQQLEQQLLQLQTTSGENDTLLAYDDVTVEHADKSLQQLIAIDHEIQENETSLRTTKEHITAQKEKLLQAQKNLQQAEDVYHRARNTISSTSHTDAINSLAGLLEEGSPCPVCGSLHHPAPALSSNAQSVRADALAQWQQAEAKYVAAQQSIANLKAQLVASETDYKHLKQTKRTLALRAQDHRNMLPSAWRSLSTEEIRAAIQETKQRHKQWKQRIETLQTEIQKQQKIVAETKEQAHRVRDAWLTATARYKSAKAHEHEAVLLEKSRRKQLRRVIGKRTAAAIQWAWQDIEKADSQLATIQENIHAFQKEAERIQAEKERAYEQLIAAENKVHALQSQMQPLQVQIQHLTEKLHRLTHGETIEVLLDAVKEKLHKLVTQERSRQQAYEKAQRHLTELEQQLAVVQERINTHTHILEKTEQRLHDALRSAGFSSTEEVTAALLSSEERSDLSERIATHEKQKKQLEHEKDQLMKRIGESWLSDAEWERIQSDYEAAETHFEQASTRYTRAQSLYEDTLSRHKQWNALHKERATIQKQKDRLDQLAQLWRGNRFVEFIAEEYLASVVVEASQRLATLTRFRYALEIDADMGFVVRDDGNGGVRRPVSSLSGGETFLTSLALALALSNQIQLHGTQPLEFFFLDEGFGSLDPDLLETVMTALEHLQAEHLHIGVISHVPELKQRISHRLIVETGNNSEEGSTLRFERA